MESSRLHAIVTGRVQGVGFRYFVLDQGQRLGLMGWVRNLRDGRVEVVAEGDPTRLQELMVELRRGPRGAYVDDMSVEMLPATGEFDAFRISH